MNPALWSAFGVIGAALVTAAGGWIIQRQAKSLGVRKEARDDFQAITERLDKEVTRMSERVTAAEQRQAAAEQREHDERRVVTVCLRFIEGLTRQLRDNGLEPPPLPAELADRMWE